ncbi:MAG: M23 family metallopeptidase [Rhodospirillales bacterium]|nr:M23 family metallopeptidase [Rhodospirillales bacterium]
MMFFRRNTAALAVVVMLWPIAATWAQEKGAKIPSAALRLSLPIRCAPGRDCWLVNLVDLDPGAGVVDYTCGKRSYDGHKGTDIAIRDLEAMKNGVDVVASAGGIVLGTRDGMADVDVTLKGKASVKGRECGNGLVVSHGAGWETQYCHMRRGSVIVKKGDTIKRGQKLGLVGHSGLAQFPHLHLSVRHKKQVVSPFAGLGRNGGCGPGPAPLWTNDALAALSIEGTAIFNAGFSSGALKPEMARSGRMAGGQMSRRSSALVLWADMYWPKAGDNIRFRLTAPDGQVLLEKNIAVEKTQARRFHFVGKKRKTTIWPTGVYRGEVVLTRQGGTSKAVTVSANREVDLR